MGTTCAAKNCNCSARCDVYFADGSCLEMCGDHAWGACDDKSRKVVQVVPWY